VRRLTLPVILLCALILALIMLILALAILGRRPDITLGAMLVGAFGSKFALIETLLRAVPIFLCALAAMIPAESGQINIGAEGQFHLGAIGAVLAAGLLINTNLTIIFPFMIAGAMLLAAMWAAIPAALRAFLRINEALVSLFLNYVAAHIVQYLVHGPLRDPASLGWPMSPPLPKELLLNSIAGTKLHAGVFVAMALGVALIIFIRYTRWGKELTAVGLNAQTSALMGIPVSRYLFFSMIAGGALAGLAGYYEIAAIQHRLRTDVSLGFGYTGFLVAWMCRGHLVLIFPISILVAGLVASSENLQIMTGLPAASSDVILGFLLLFVLLGRPMLKRFEEQRAIRFAIGRAND
jgi:general nucleoside transport system permease protein